MLRKNAHPFVCGGLLSLLVCAPAAAQYAVGYDGRLLDANPQFGGSRINTARPVSPLYRGNLSADGSISAGLSLRSTSPIESPFAFRGSLGSDLLGSFVRDSVSVYDARRLDGGILPTRPYYSASRTAPTAGFLQYGGLTPTFSPMAIAPSRTLPGQLDFGAPAETRTHIAQSPSVLGRIGVNRATTPAPELSSSIFGADTRIPGLLETQLYTDLAALDRTPSAGADSTEEQSPLWRPRQYRLDLPQRAPGALEGLMSGDRDELLARGWFQAPDADSDSAAPAPASDSAAHSWREFAAQTRAMAPGVSDDLQPGGDVFTDLALARSLELDPSADWFGMLRAAEAGDAAGSSERETALEADAQAFVDRVLNTRLTTFVGAARTSFNDELLAAESLVETGRYYDAIGHYDRAARLAPANPLPLIGKGHALLAAGEYLSAAFNIVRGVQRYPEIARVQFNLAAMLGGGETVDIRRAEIMRLLGSREDEQLRFLLGYLEWHSGNRQFALENLDRAARNAPLGSIIRRFPELLRGVNGQSGSAPAPAPETPPDVSETPPAADPG